MPKSKPKSKVQSKVQSKLKRFVFSILPLVKSIQSKSVLSKRGLFIVEALVAGAVGAAVLTGYWGTLQGSVNSLVLSRIVMEEQDLNTALTNALSPDSCNENISKLPPSASELSIRGSVAIRATSSPSAFKEYLYIQRIGITATRVNQEVTKKFEVFYQAKSNGSDIGTPQSKSCTVAYQLDTSNAIIPNTCSLLDCGELSDVFKACEQLFSQTKCDSIDSCEWDGVNGVCDPKPKPDPCDGLDQASCVAESKCNWGGGLPASCKPKPCDQLASEPDCKDGSNIDRCEWDGGTSACKDKPVPVACKDPSLSGFTCSLQPDASCCNNNSNGMCVWGPTNTCEQKPAPLCADEQHCSAHPTNTNNCCDKDKDCYWVSSSNSCEDNCDLTATATCAHSAPDCCNNHSSNKCTWVGGATGSCTYSCVAKGDKSKCGEHANSACCAKDPSFCSWDPAGNSGAGACEPKCEALDCAERTAKGSSCCTIEGATSKCEWKGGQCQIKPSCESLTCTQRGAIDCARGDITCKNHSFSKDSHLAVCCLADAKCEWSWYTHTKKCVINPNPPTCDNSKACKLRSTSCCEDDGKCKKDNNIYLQYSCREKACPSGLSCTDRTHTLNQKTCCKSGTDCQWVKVGHVSECKDCSATNPNQCSARKTTACCAKNTSCQWDQASTTNKCKDCTASSPNQCSGRKTKACCAKNANACKWEGATDTNGVCYDCDFSKACSAHSKTCCENPNNNACEWDNHWLGGSCNKTCGDNSTGNSCNVHNNDERCCRGDSLCKWDGAGTCQKASCTELKTQATCEHSSNDCEWESDNKCYPKCHEGKTECGAGLLVSDKRCCLKKKKSGSTKKACEWDASWKGKKCDNVCGDFATTACSAHNERCCDKNNKDANHSKCIYDTNKSQCRKKCLSSLTCSGVEGTLNEQTCCNNASDRKCQWKWSGSKNTCLLCDSSTPATCLGRKSRACCDRKSPTCKWWTGSGSGICCDTTKQCASITNIACCDRSLKGCLWEGGACRAPKNCPADATVRGNCSRVLPQTNHNQKATVTCKAGYSGTCEATCHDGAFKNFRNTCVENKCPAKTIDGCSLLKASYGATKTCSCSSTKNSYWSGSRTYKCNKSGTGIWEPHSGSCTYTPPPPSGCSTSTYNNCKRYAKSHGSTSGTCVNGTSGSCSYKCNNGSWSYQSNSCKTPSPSPPSPPTPRQPSPPPPIPPITPRTTTVSYSSCSASTYNNCYRAYRSHGGYAGSCVSGYTRGSCSYKCNNGSWSYQSNSCAKPASYSGCSGKTTSNCVLGSAGHLASSGSCASSYSGSCSYKCNNGSWSKSTNSCTKTTPTCYQYGSCILRCRAYCSGACHWHAPGNHCRVAKGGVISCSLSSTCSVHKTSGCCKVRGCRWVYTGRVYPRGGRAAECVK